MKHYAILTIMVAFLVNMLAVSAWAKPCLTDMGLTSMPGATAEMPCHDTNTDREKSSQPQNHCEGICMCLHAAFSQNILPVDDVLSIHPSMVKTSNIFTDQNWANRKDTPLRRPPKFIS